MHQDVDMQRQASKPRARPMENDRRYFQAKIYGGSIEFKQFLLDRTYSDSTTSQYQGTEFLMTSRYNSTLSNPGRGAIGYCFAAPRIDGVLKLNIRRRHPRNLGYSVAAGNDRVLELYPSVNSICRSYSFSLWTTLLETLS